MWDTAGRTPARTTAQADLRFRRQRTGYRIRVRISAEGCKQLWDRQQDSHKARCRNVVLVAGTGSLLRGGARSRQRAGGCSCLRTATINRRVRFRMQIPDWKVRLVQIEEER